MISFMFATLGSVGFWVIYFVISIFATVITLKIMDKDTFDYVVLRKKETDLKCMDATRCTVFAVMVFILWPGFLFAAFVYRCLLSLLWPAFCNILGKANNVMPTITFGDEKEDGDD